MASGLRFAACCAVMAVPAPAWADVLEIGDDGARWVSGANVVAAVVDAADGDDLFDPTSPEALRPSPTTELSLIPAAFRETVRELSARYSLSPALIEALVWQESRWRHNAVSHKGARGLTQLMPSTARELGVDPDDPHANLEGGARYLRAQLDRFEGNLQLALAAYNAGPNRVERVGGIPAIRETRHYVASIINRMNATQGVYR